MKNKENVFIFPPCGEQPLAPEGFNPGVARATKEGQNRNKTSWPLLPRLAAVLPPQGREMRRGFTLIELLVVVLIIGILAAVAVPQYQQSIMKSRFMQGILLCDAVYKAEKVYYLAHGTYTDQFANLDIDLTGIGTLSPDGNSILTPYFDVWLNMADPHCWVSGAKSNFPNYYFYMRGRKDCRVNANNALQRKVCLSLGGELQTGQKDIYIL